MMISYMANKWADLLLLWCGQVLNRLVHAIHPLPEQTTWFIVTVLSYSLIVQSPVDHMHD